MVTRRKSNEQSDKTEKCLIVAGTPFTKPQEEPESDDTVMIKDTQLSDFERCLFPKLRQNNACVALSISSSNVNLYSGEQLGLRVTSVWRRSCRKKFFLYYGMTLGKLRDRCLEMEAKGFDLKDLSTYLDVLGRV